MDAPQPVAILAPEVSRRIAAGEVIERPASVVRELVDNSLDSGADEIDITWSGGGSETLRVRDNGCGLSQADLELCWKPHATSKIRTIEDLDRTRSLGFRGEALSSIAAVSTMSIATTPAGGHRGFRLKVDQATMAALEPAPPTPGTTIEVRRLFSNLPARRRFLSRPQAETTAIGNVVRDKAMAFPAVRFTFQSDGGKMNVLPPQGLLQRVGDIFGGIAPVQSLHEITGSGEGFTVTIIAAHPEIVRRDRRYIRTYVNSRRVWEYRLTQAVEYAFQDVQHGGLFPVAALFVEIDPALVDFNIHPAKREVRIRPAADVHHRIVELLRSFLRAYAVKTVQFDREFTEPSFSERRPPTHRIGPVDDSKANTQRAGGPGIVGAAGRPPRQFPRPQQTQSVAERPSFEHRVKTVPDPAPADATGTSEDLLRAREAAGSDALAYRGTIFETYIVVEWNDRAYMIDQHAAHERLLYDHYRNHRAMQRFLVPEEFAVTDDQDVLLQRHTTDFAAIGIGLERTEPGRWRLIGAPPEYREETETVIETIIELQPLNEGMDRLFLAELACKAAVKGGDFVDELTALELARRTLIMETPRCPHGRPLWVELTRHSLDRLIGRV